MSKFLPIVILFLGLDGSVRSRHTHPPHHHGKCGRNAHWSEQPGCDVDCIGVKYNRTYSCPDPNWEDNAGCECDQGYIFEEGWSGPCIEPNQCHKVFERLQATCGKNAHYIDTCSGSASECHRNCETLNHIGFFKCKAICRRGCDCLPGFVFLQGQSGDCVQPNQCPAAMSGN